MAGLPWIKVWTVVALHPKVQRLEKELRLKDALGVVVRLWCWTADYAPEGEIPESDAPTAAKFARGEACRTRPADMLSAFLAVGLLDHVPGGYRVHDWHEMQTKHVEAEEKRRDQAAERQRRFREKEEARRSAERDSNAPVTRDVTRDVTVTSVTREEGEEDKREKKISHARSPQITVAPPEPTTEGGRAGQTGGNGTARRKVFLGPLGAVVLSRCAQGLGKSLIPLSSSADAEALESAVRAHGGIEAAVGYFASTCRQRGDAFDPQSARLVLDVLRDPLPAETA